MSLRATVERALAPGYSTCLRCGRPWKFVAGHITDYAPGRGCFPLCESCWAELETPAQRLPYYRSLVGGWGRWTEDNWDRWPDIKRAVEAGL